MFAITSVKKTARVFVMETPFHGIQWIYQGGMGKKVLYTILIAMAVVGFAYQAGVAVAQYNGGDPAPSTTYTVSDDGTAEIPPFDICLPARFEKDRVASQSLSPTVLELLHFSFMSTLLKGINGIFEYDYNRGGRTPLANRLMEFQAAKEELMVHLNSTGMDVGTLIDYLSFRCEDFLLYVYEREHVIWDFCKHTRPVRTQLGHCTRFPSSVQLMDRVGSARVYRMILPVERYAPGMYRPYSGVYLRVVPEEPDNRWVPIPLHARTDVEIRLTRGSYMNTARNRCQQRKAGAKSRSRCMYDCVLGGMFSAKHCTCFPYDAEVEHNSTICTAVDAITCVLTNDDVVAGSTGQLSEQAFDRCGKSCPQYCHIDEYQFTPMVMPFAYEQVVSYDGSNALQNNSIILEVYYDSLRSVQITQFPSISFVDLVANVGGLLGLWLGGSALAIAHLCFVWCTPNNAQTKTGNI